MVKGSRQDNTESEENCDSNISTAIS